MPTRSQGVTRFAKPASNLIPDQGVTCLDVKMLEQALIAYLLHPLLKGSGCMADCHLVHVLLW